MAVASVLLSLCLTTGAMAAVGFPFNPIIAVSPYLVLAIGSFASPFVREEDGISKFPGVDDAFMILGAWRKGGLSEALDEVGPAIVVTTATDALTFAVGFLLSQTPAMGSLLSQSWLNNSFLFEPLYCL